MPAAARKQPEDRLAKAEANGTNIVVNYGGETYTIHRDNADNLELMEFVEDEKYITAIRGYLGRDQWDKWKAAVRTEDGRVPASAFEPFLNAVMAQIGGGTSDAPNSGASPTS